MSLENELDNLGKESVVASQEIKSLSKHEKNELCLLYTSDAADE